MNSAIKHNYPIELNELPPSWAVAQVGDLVVEIRSGKASGRHSLEPPGFVHLRPMNITREGRIDLSDVRYAPEELIDEFPKVQKGDVIFNNTNSRELIGKTSSIDISADWSYSNHMTILRFAPSLSYRFMAHQLHYLWMTGYFRNLSKQHVNQASVSIRTISETVLLVIPPSQEQHRIVDEIETQFSRLAASRASLESSKRKAAAYRQSVLRSAVSGKLVANEAELARRELRPFEPASVLLQKIKRNLHIRATGSKAEPTFWDAQAPKGATNNDEPLPEGWAWALVGDIGEVRLGRQRSPKHHTGPHLRPYLRVANVFEDRIDTSDVKSMNFTPEEYEVYHVRHGDILLNEGQSLELVGRPALFRGEVPNVCFQNTLIRVRTGEGIDPEFALIVFRHYFHSKKFQRIARWSTNIAHLGLKRFAAMRFPLPPVAEQKRIVAEVKRLLSIISVQEQTINSLIQRGITLRRSILAKAFGGRLIPQDPSEGSGKDLLAEIEVLLRDKPGDSTKRRAKTITPKVSSAMPRRTRLPIYDALMSAGGRLTAAELFEQCGFDDQTVDEFYEGLKAELELGRIRESRNKDASETEDANLSYIEIAA